MSKNDISKVNDSTDLNYDTSVLTMYMDSAFILEHKYILIIQL